jgi:hypothetical protein
MKPGIFSARGPVAPKAVRVLSFSVIGGDSDESTLNLFGSSRRKRIVRRASSASAAAESLFFASPKKRNHKKGDPTLAPRCCPALLASLGPARTRPSMASNIRAFPPSPAALLGAIDGIQEPTTTSGELLLLALDPPSRRSRRRAGGSAATAGARRKRASFSPVHGRAVEKPRRTDANPPKAGAISGCPSLLVPFSWARKREVTRPPPRRTKPRGEFAVGEESKDAG